MRSFATTACRWSRALSCLAAAMSLGACDAVLGLGNLKDGPAPDAATSAGDGGGAQPDATTSGGDADSDSGANVGDDSGYIDVGNGGNETGPTPDAGTPDASGSDSGLPIAPPQPIAPLSTALVTSQEPSFHWTLATGTTGAQVDICRDRACSTIVESFTATGTTGKPTSALSRGTYFWRARGVLNGVVGESAGPVWEVRVGAHSAAVDTSWGTIVDPNGDGYADLLVGSGSGLFLYLSTGAAGLGTAATTVASSGSSVASAGDVNGDGYADLIVGIGGINNTGSVYVYFGGPSSVPTAPSVTIPAVGGVNGNFGASIASAGDVNGDGYADIVVGDANANNVGAAYVYLGGPKGTATSPATILNGPGVASAHFGSPVATAGDVNGDGYGDVVVGAYMLNSNEGGAYVYLGGPSGLTSTPKTISGTVSEGYLGVNVASAGDINGDGYADIALVQDDVTEGSGVSGVYLYLGSASGVSSAAAASLVEPAAAGAGAFGTSLASVGDVNGDGYGDLVVGAPQATNEAGIVYLYLGNASAVPATPTPFNDPNGAANDLFGGAVAGVGDVDGNGYDDIAVGAAGGTTGAAYVFFGATAGVSASSYLSIVAPVGNVTGFGATVE